MEQTVFENPLSQEQHTAQLHTQHNDTVNGSGAQLEQDQTERRCPRRWTGQRGTAHGGSFGGGHLRQDTVQMPLCRDNLRGKCARGAFCKYQHSESGEHDRSRFCLNEREKLCAAGTLGNSRLCRENGDNDSTMRFSSSGSRRRSPCRRFQSGRCYRGESCPYLHPEMTNFDKSMHHWSANQQQVDRAVKDPGFGGRNRDNFVRISQEHVEANKEINSRIMSFSGDCRSRSPCQHFLRGRCDFGAPCKCWHPVKANVRSGHDLNTQHHQGIAATSRYPGPGERSQDGSLRNFREHEEANMHYHLRTGAFSRELRSRSPCQNYLRGKCYRGESCVHLHPVTAYDRPKFDSWSGQQHQRVSSTTFRISPKHEDRKNSSNQPYQDTHAFNEHNKACLTLDGVQLAGNRVNMDLTSRSSSYKGQGSRMAGNVGGDKPVREVCLKFTRGRCNRGEMCRYLHGYHEYATSISHWSEKPDTEDVGGSRNFGVENQYANTMIAQERADEKNYQMPLGEVKHTESNLISSDSCFDKEAKGKPLDAKYLDHKDDATTRDGLKCEVSGEKAEGHENISLWSRPVKRQRSSCREDDFHFRKFGRYDSQFDLRGGGPYNVAQFQYPDRRSHRYEKPIYHVNGRQCSRSEATSMNPCTHENKDTKFVTPQRHEEVDNQGLQLEQHANGSHDLNVVIAGKKIEADSARCALQPNNTNQNDEELTTDSVAVYSDEHLVSPISIDRTMFDKETNVDVPIDLYQEGKEKIVDFVPLIKTYVRRNSRKRQPISGEETVKEEMIDASKQGTPSCSVVKASSNDPNIVSLSGIPVDMKLSVSRNDDLDNVFVDDHPFKEKVKKRKRKHPNSASCEETVIEEEALKLGMPISSLVETSLSNPNIPSVSCIPVDTVLGASRNNNLENVLVDDHPTREKVKKKCKRKLPNSASCEESVEEVTKASKSGTPISSLVETSLSNPNIESVSCIPVDMEQSASRNNDLEDVLVEDHLLKEQIKKRKKRQPNSASVNETLKEEVTEAKIPGIIISSLVGTSVSNLKIASGFPVDMELSASRNNDLENVHDHPAKKQVKKKHKKKYPSPGSCEEALKEHGTESSEPGIPISPLVETPSGNPVKQQETASMTSNTEKNVESALGTIEHDTLLAGNADSHLLQALQSSPKGVFPCSRRKLLVLDVNGILVDIVATHNPLYTPDTMVSSKAVFKRPFCDDFLQFCFEKFDVGIWSSRIKNNLTRVVDFLMKDTKNKLLFCWDQSQCTATGYKTFENRQKPLVLKELRYLWWDNKWERLPWDKGYYNETNTVLLDDSPYKALRNPPYTAVFPHSYDFKNADDNSLGPGGDLRVYLEKLAEAENVPKFIKENPFGQNPISFTSSKWRYYSNIVGTHGSQQEEYVNIIFNSSKISGTNRS